MTTYRWNAQGNPRVSGKVLKLNVAFWNFCTSFHFVICTSILATDTEVKWEELLAIDPEVRVRFPALPDFLRSSGSKTGST
jgi:hypothetical protein